MADERIAGVSREGDEEETAVAGCPVPRGTYGPPCGRPLHLVPPDRDEKPVCLMHSKDAAKQAGELFDEFWAEFEAILKSAGENPAHFEGFVFPRVNQLARNIQPQCWFHDAVFTEDFDFSHSRFMKAPQFLGATFQKEAKFGSCEFVKGASFQSATFHEGGNFYGAVFTESALFRLARITGGADFRLATFTKDVSFFDTKFKGTVKFEKCQFLESAEFRGTVFESGAEDMPGAKFGLASFSKPGSIVFDNVDLSRVLFHNCDVSQFWFSPSVRWGVMGSRKAVVFDEIRPPTRYDAREVYQQLKKNYDARLDYWTANEFHFGEMEMKRLARPMRGPLFRLRQSLYRRLSLVALYRYASDYGNSYWKPLAWMVAMLAGFSVLYPLPGVGLARSGVPGAETYASVPQAKLTTVQNAGLELELVGRSLLAAIDVAGFQKSPEYSPSYPWGRVLAIVETVLTSTLFGLFLLAIRRQFRR